MATQRKPTKRGMGMVFQKLMGVGMLVLCAFVIVTAFHGTALEDRDATTALLLAPMGIYLIFSKRCWIR